MMKKRAFLAQFDMVSYFSLALRALSSSVRSAIGHLSM